MSIKVSTGRISDSVEVIDTIFAMDSHKEGFWSGSADPNIAFEGVKKSADTEMPRIRRRCRSRLSI